MANVVTLTGNITHARFKPAVKETKSGGFFLALSLATFRDELDRARGQVSIPTFHRVVVYGNKDYLENDLLPFALDGVPLSLSGEMRYSSSFKDGVRSSFSEVFVQPIKNIGWIEFPNASKRMGVS